MSASKTSPKSAKGARAKLQSGNAATPTLLAGGNPRIAKGKGDAPVQAYIAAGKLSAGHARALIGVPDPGAAAKRIVEEGLNVRQAEALAHEEGVPVRKVQKPRSGGGLKTKDADTVALEKRVSDALGLAVTVDHRDPGGTVVIRYRDLDQLDGVIERLEAKG